MAGKITKSEDEWRAQLSPEAFEVTRKGGSERSFSHDGFPDTKGIYNCVCCGATLFDSDGKYDPGTGWPSFFQPHSKDAMEEHVDNSFIVQKTLVKCAKCNAHIGEVISDGPDPTGLRYSVNGVALVFITG